MQKDRFKNWKAPKLEERKLHPKYHFLIQHIDNIKIGENTDIGAFTYINAKNGVEIEKNAQIGSHCSIYTVSTIDNKEGSIKIKENARVSSHCTIMPGVKIGKNAVVGAHSFVNKDIPDNSIAYGVPVKIIRKKKK